MWLILLMILCIINVMYCNINDNNDINDNINV